MRSTASGCALFNVDLAAKKGRERPYMDAPGLPSCQFGMDLGKIATVHPDFRCGSAAVPDGIRWSAPQSLLRARGAADVVGFADHGLTFHAITA
jgi:hypothetical protein